MPSTVTTRAKPRATFGVLPGLLVAVAVAAVASLLGALVPIVGAPVFGVVGGALTGTLTGRFRERLAPGAGFAAGRVLKASIVVLGTGLSLGQVLRVGGRSLPVMLGTLAAALLGAVLLGRLLRIDRDVRTLIGVGTGICGASAIAAVTAVIEPAEIDVAYAVGTIFTFNIAAVLLFPALGHLLGLSQQSFGLFAGTAVNDTSSVVAAAYTYGSAAGAYGVVVKLTRSLMIVPVCLALRLLRRDAAPADHRWWRVVPLFVVGFLAASLADSLGWVPASWHAPLGTAATFLITVALSGIGLALRPADLRRSGPKPLLLGGLLWLVVAGTSLGLQLTLGQL